MMDALIDLLGALFTLFPSYLELWCASWASCREPGVVESLCARFAHISRAYCISVPRQLIGTVETAAIDESINLFDSLVQDRFELGSEHRVLIIERKTFHKETLHGLFRLLPSLFGFRYLIGGRRAFPRLRVSNFRVIICLDGIRPSLPRFRQVNL